MSKQAAAIQSENQASTTTLVRREARAAKIAEAERLAYERFLAAYNEWHQTADSIPKRRAYIRKMCRRIAEEFKPEKIILFGSYAYGKPTMESDVDLAVVMEFEGGQAPQAHKITQRLNLPLPLDLLVYTPEQWRYRLEIGDRFIQEIAEQGKVMHEAAHA